MFLRNAWYVAAWAHEVTGTPIERRLLDEPVALYRQQSGAPVAIGSLCPHRFASMGHGKVINDTLQCPYHGLRFDASGVCVHNPHGDGTIPKAARVKSYPLVERYGALWIWMGDPDRADPALVPDFSMFDPPAITSVNGYLHVAAHYELVTDNLLDLTHVAFLHPLLGNPGAESRSRTQLKQDGEYLWAMFWQDNEPVTPLFRMVWDSPSTHGDLRAHMRWSAPSTLYLDVGQTEVNAAPDTGPALPSAHLLTPETASTTHYFWMVGRNVKHDDLALGQALQQGVGAAFANEDEPMIARVQHNMAGRELFSLRPVLLGGDAAAVRARRILAQRIQEEATQ